MGRFEHLWFQLGREKESTDDCNGALKSSKMKILAYSWIPYYIKLAWKREFELSHHWSTIEFWCWHCSPWHYIVCVTEAQSCNMNWKQYQTDKPDPGLISSPCLHPVWIKWCWFAKCHFRMKNFITGLSGILVRVSWTFHLFDCSSLVPANNKNTDDVHMSLIWVYLRSKSHKILLHLCICLLMMNLSNEILQHQ